MNELLSIAIETTCTHGGIALGRGDAIVAQDFFDASQRHATHLVSKLKAMVERCGAAPREIGELYISVGPGSFTGTRVGVTVARTLAQAVPAIRCVAVPTAIAIADAAAGAPWRNLAVLADATQGGVHVSMFRRASAGEGGEHAVGGPFEHAGERDIAVADLPWHLPRPVLAIGPAAHVAAVTAVLAGQAGIDLLPSDSPLHLPTPSAVWRIGRRMAAAGEFTEYHRLLPIYSRPPEAVRLLDKR